MKIYHQHGSHIDCYQRKHSIQKLSLRSPIEELLFECRNESDSIFLLDESYFDLVACTIEGSFYEPISIQVIDAVVAAKVKELQKKKQISGQMLLYDIDRITVDQEPSVYPINKTGYVSFQLSLVCIKPSLINSCPTILHKTFGPKVYPASYFSLQFIVHNLEKQNFALVSISEDNARLITINQGRYYTIQSIDRGYQHIKQMCATHNILSYFYKSDEDLQANPIAHSIMQQSIGFYNKMLIDWIATWSGDKHPDSIVIAPQLKHHVFWESFTDLYRQKINGYVVPFSITDSLDHYGRKRQAHELDVLTCLNLFDSKQLVG